MTSIGDLCFDEVTTDEAVGRAIDAVRTRMGLRIITPNIDVLAQCQRDPVLGERVSRAGMLVADGMPIVWLSRLLRQPLPERVSGSTLARRLLQEALAAGWSVAICASEPGLAEAAYASVRADLQVAAAERTARLLPLHFSPCFSPEAPEASRLLERLEAHEPDLVLVGMDFAKQERFLDRAQERLPNAVLLGCGIGIAHMAGRRRRAPGWMQAHGMEWLFRLAQEPVRLWRRYIIRDLPFAAHLILQSVMPTRGSRLPR